MQAALRRLPFGRYAPYENFLKPGVPRLEPVQYALCHMEVFCWFPGELLPVVGSPVSFILNPAVFLRISAPRAAPPVEQALERSVCVFFYLLSRCMRPEGPWQRRVFSKNNHIPSQTTLGQPRAP